MKKQYYRECSIKKGVLENFSKFKEKHLCQRLLFSCEFYEIFKNNFSTERLWATASPKSWIILETYLQLPVNL